MIMVGKIIASLIWIFWVIVIDSTASGQPLSDNETEYIPTYSSTFDRVKKRGYVICGTNDEFPGFSQNSWNSEDGSRWEGFDVDICRAIAAAIFGDADAIEFTIVNGKTRFEFLIDGSIDVLSATTTFTYTRNVAKKLEFMPTTYYDGQGFIVRKTLGVSSAKQMEGARICFSGSGTAAKNIY
jgi:general L-amino acid transport system substrate-binding protein